MKCHWAELVKSLTNALSNMLCSCLSALLPADGAIRSLLSAAAASGFASVPGQQRRGEALGHIAREGMLGLLTGCLHTVS